MSATMGTFNSDGHRLWQCPACNMAATDWARVQHPESCPAHPDAKTLALASRIKLLEQRLGTLETWRQTQDTIGRGK